MTYVNFLSESIRKYMCHRNVHSVVAEMYRLLKKLFNTLQNKWKIIRNHEIVSNRLIDYEISNNESIL